MVSTCRMGEADQGAADPRPGAYCWRNVEEDLAEDVRVERCAGE